MMFNFERTSSGGSSDCVDSDLYTETRTHQMSIIPLLTLVQLACTVIDTKKVGRREGRGERNQRCHI